MDTFNPFGDNIPIKRKLRNTYGVIKEIWFHKNTTIMKKEFLKTGETIKTKQHRWLDIKGEKTNLAPKL